MPDIIERLVVALEADASKLERDTTRAVDAAADKMGDLDKASKRTEGRFGKLGQAARKFGQTAKRAFAVLKVAVLASVAAVAALGVGFAAAFKAAEQGLASVRIRRSFRALAASAGQSSRDIIVAMKEASGGTIREMELMRQANVALQLGVARTPEEFAKLTRSAIVLGRSVGRGPVEALDDLINAAGRRSTEVLDNLGISLSDVNAKMESLAQQEFGKPASQLDQAAKNALFMKAALEVADEQAQKLGGSVEDIGSGLEKTKTQVEDFKTDLNEAFLVVVGQASNIAQAMNASFFGPDGVFPLFTEGGNIVAEVFGRILTGFLAVAGGIVKTVNDVRKVFSGDLGIGDLNLGRVAENFSSSFDQAFEKIKADFSEVFDPGSVPAQEVGFQIGSDMGEGIEEGLDQSAARDMLGDLTGEFADLQNESQAEMEENARQHSKRMAEIDQAEAKARADIARKRSDALADLERETAREREQIIADAKQELADLEKQTDEDLADESEDFNVDERRRLEDHLAAMRQIRMRFLETLEDAVKNRDARAIVDARRRFNQEQQQEETKFTSDRERRGEDFDRRLEEIREHERQAADEITRAREQDLANLAQNEADKRAEIERNFQEENARATERFAEQRERETEQFEERQAELEASLQKRLESLAKELADEEDINREGAEAVLKALDETFGIGGDIDALMEDFAKRRRQKFRVEVAFEEVLSGGGGAPALGSGGGGPGPGGGALGGPAVVPLRFQHGGQLLAKPPGTLALFGEAQPEVAQFIPLAQMQRNVASQQTKRTEIDLNFRGSAPPGIRSGDRDQIARVIVDALRAADVEMR